MSIRTATPEDAPAIAAIYAPIVAGTAISFEIEAPTADEMRSRVQSILMQLPWLVSMDGAGEINGYAYASRHRERAAYQWSVDATAYVREDSRSRGVGKQLYHTLFAELLRLGYFQVFAGITLPNEASMALHESVGFLPIGIYKRVGFKLDAWHDVGWWQKQLRAPEAPTTPKAYSERLRTA